MHVFVDESGDLGFSEASTKYFVAAYVECTASEMLRTQLKRLLKNLHQKKKYHKSRNELKFSRMNDDGRRKVLEKIIECEVSLGAVVMEKKRVNAQLRKDPARLYNWFVVHNIMLSLLPQIEDRNKMQITFDKSLPMWRIGEFNSYVTNKASYLLFEKGAKLPPNCISLSHIASENEFGLQAADAIAGAFFQKFEKQNDEFTKIIEPKVGFFKHLWK